MADQGKPLVDRVWEFTKDLSVKVSRKAEKHWKINTLRVEIASIKHRINVKYKELGRYVYESIKSSTLEEESYKATVQEFFDDLARFESQIVDRENRIQILEQEMEDLSQPPPPVPDMDQDQGSAPPPVPDIDQDQGSAPPPAEHDPPDEPATDTQQAKEPSKPKQKKTPKKKKES